MLFGDTNVALALNEDKTKIQVPIENESPSQEKVRSSNLDQILVIYDITAIKFRAIAASVENQPLKAKKSGRIKTILCIPR